MPRLPAVATRWLGRGFVFLLLAAVGMAPALAAAGRWALVIGNDEYKRVEPLRNAVADAALIAAELKRAGFEVASLSNVDRRTFLREVIELSRRAEGGGEAVVYFAGHGVQVANTNYLLPVDFDSGDEAMLPFEAVSLTEVSNQLLDAKTRFSLLIVDACRNNPLPGRRGRNCAPGLAWHRCRRPPARWWCSRPAAARWPSTGWATATPPAMASSRGSSRARCERPAST